MTKEELAEKLQGKSYYDVECIVKRNIDAIFDSKIIIATHDTKFITLHGFICGEIRNNVFYFKNDRILINISANSFITGIDNNVRFEFLTHDKKTCKGIIFSLDDLE